jgi:hypothetical protein
MDFISFPIYKIDENGVCTCPQSMKDKDLCSPGKHPKVKFLEAKTPHPFNNKIENLGIRTGQINRLLVVDIDAKKDGVENFQKLQKEIGILDDTWRVNTGGGGFHLYYKLREDQRFSNSSDMIAPGIDIRGENGYVVGPGSNHVSGKRYQWDPEFCELEGMVFEYVPDILVPFLSNHREVENKNVDTTPIDDETLEVICKALEHIPAEEREKRSYWVRIGMALKSVSYQGRDLFHLWDNWSKAASNYGNTEKTWKSLAPASIGIGSIIHDAKAFGYKPPRKEVDPGEPPEWATAPYQESAPIAQVIPLPKKPEPEPKLEYMVGLPPEGLYRDLILEIEKEWIQFPRHISMFIAHIALAPIFQGIIKTPKGGTICTYAVITGIMGCSKTNAIMKWMEPFLREIDPRIISPHNASDTGLKKMYGEDGVYNNSATMMIEEVLGTFKKWHLQAERGDIINQTINGLWGGTNLARRVAADSDKYGTEEVVSPSLSIIGGGTTSEWIALTQNSDFLSKGLGSRLEMVEWGNVIYKRGQTYQSNMNRYKRFTDHFSSLRKNLLGSVYSYDNRKEIGWGEGAEDLFESKQEYCHEETNKFIDNPDGHRGVSLRLPEMALRMATRIAACEMEVLSPNVTSEPVISKELFAWCWEYVYNRDLIYKVSSDKDNSDESTYRDRSLVELAKGVPMKKSALTRKCAKRLKLKPVERDAVLNELRDSGEIYYNHQTKEFSITPLGRERANRVSV